MNKYAKLNDELLAHASQMAMLLNKRGVTGHFTRNDYKKAGLFITDEAADEDIRSLVDAGIANVRLNSRQELQYSFNLTDTPARILQLQTMHQNITAELQRNEYAVQHYRNLLETYQGFISYLETK